MESVTNRLIINADDFGLDHQTNLAIVRAFDQGLCSSCTIMANMPAFEEACERVHGHGLTGSTGLHLTLTEGCPVTDRIKTCVRFCDKEGWFALSRRQRVLHLDAQERRALAEEIDGQIRMCRRRGVPLTHLDAHKHVHEEWAITSVLMAVVRQAGIPSVRLCKTFGFGISRVKRLYRRLVNLRLRRAGLARTDFFGAPDDYRLFWQTLGTATTAVASWEVMIHPSFGGDGKLVDAWLKRPLEDMVRAMAGYEEACSYTGCRLRQPTSELTYAVL
jgi:chitin disaccharide deacetylase